MSDNTKELIIKIGLVIWFILLFAMLSINLIFAFIFDFDYESITDTLLIVCLVEGILVMILQVIFGGLKRPTVKASKVESKFEDFNQLLEYIRTSLFEREYIEQKVRKIPNNGEVILFLKKNKIGRLVECFTIIRVPELSEEIIDIAENKITEILTENYGKKIFFYYVDMITMFCVDHITPSFKEIVNSNMQQGIKNGRMVAGISFDGKYIYIANQKDGYAIAKYKKLRKKFIKIMNLKK